MRVFNVPSSAPFLHTVIEALVDGRLVAGFDARANPELLADATLYLPTRRAGRLAREIFLDVLKTDAVVLPRIVALGSVDEDELEFSDAAQLGGAEASNLPPKLDDLERKLTLARLVAAWAKRQPESLVVGGPASTLALAGDLARLMDDMVTRGVGWTALDGIVPDELDIYWQHTLAFLKIAKETWPDYLSAIDRIEPAARRDLLIAAEIARLTAKPKGPVIAAGSTGSMPTTARLLHAIATLPQGAVVLPGLDTHLDDDAWNSIGDIEDAGDTSTPPPTWSHPQFALHHLLSRVFKIERRDVIALAEPAAHGREVLASEAMRPAGVSAEWYTQLEKPEVAPKIAGGMTNLAVVEAANPEMEALAIAVAMREARDKNLTAALVTPDRALARRVMASLDRWSLDYDDSGGDALMDTPAGLFARLAAEAVADQLAPPTLLALLKHPLFRLGKAQGFWTAAISDLELALLRGTRPAAGSDGLARDFARFRDELGKLRRRETSAIHGSEPRAQLDDVALDAVQMLIDELTLALKPLEAIKRGKPHDFIELAACHRDVIIALSTDDATRVVSFENNDGNALSKAFDELFQSTGAPKGDDKPPPPSGLVLALADYPDVFQTAFSDRIVRRLPNGAPRLRIYGPLEARLTESDRVILGGLVEGVWPPAPRVDPWLSRPMRHQLGLDLPERRIGLSAHDFAQLLGAKDVILSRAAKVGGAPAVASRFLHRLEAVAGEKLWKQAEQRGENYTRWADELDHPVTVTPAPQPMPMPAVALRPLKMSVTEIEDWLRDPYTIYAKYILRLAPLDAVDTPPGARDRGTVIHGAIGDYTKEFAKAPPADPLAELIRLGEKHFAALADYPEAKAFWWPRYERIAKWFADWDAKRRGEIATLHAEIGGALTFSDGKRDFTLTGIADRIEHRKDGTYAILDYKTGAARTDKQVRTGLAPQLTLEAAILREGGFKTIAPGSVSEITYVTLKGGDPAGKQETIKLKDSTPDAHADTALSRLKGVAALFADASNPYLSLVHPMWKTHYGDYDHLARVKEWSLTGGGDEGGE